MRTALLASLCLLAASPAFAGLLSYDHAGQVPLMGVEQGVQGAIEAMPLARVQMKALSAQEREGIRALLSVRITSAVPECAD